MNDFTEEKKKTPNQALERTPMLVTDRAGARSAPSTGVAHLWRSAHSKPRNRKHGNSISPNRNICFTSDYRDGRQEPHNESQKIKPCRWYEEETGRSYKLENKPNHQPENQTHAYDYHWLYKTDDLAEPGARANDHAWHVGCGAALGAKHGRGSALTFGKETMKLVDLDLTPIKDWDTFHDLFAATFGFPAYYGRNMDAWIDCMGDVAGEKNELIFLHLTGAKALKDRCPEIFEAINECSAFLNYRQRESDANPIISISYHV